MGAAIFMLSMFTLICVILMAWAVIEIIKKSEVMRITEMDIKEDPDDRSEIWNTIFELTDLKKEV